MYACCTPAAANSPSPSLFRSSLHLLRGSPSGS
ncbi:hypothetical protein CKAH01_03473 [Colletotrichum kahawae]|uniref:Uncharacterized protein n=1 Tax=Colletotrichum kahawae TaxID=34407 RepID=A0AAE0DCA9_COLKA|nr:hypothetical protein CKAH01_03473 [Colletotrichum kahawae]